MDNKNVEIAYVCDGLVPECSGKVGCFKYPNASYPSDDTCWHTTDPKHAIYGTCFCPEEWVPYRFKIIGDSKDGITRYYEEWDSKAVEDIYTTNQMEIRI